MGKEADTSSSPCPTLREVPDTKLGPPRDRRPGTAVSQMVRDLHLGQNVILHFRMVPEEERILYYAAADICVFPSKYEPFGIVCTEAMSMGKPVVVGAKGTSGFREQVIPEGDGICGFHVDPGDPEDIARYVVAVLRDPDLARKMGKNGRRRVLENFTWDAIADRTLAVYQATGRKPRTCGRE